MKKGLWRRFLVICVLLVTGGFVWRTESADATTDISANSIGRVYSETENGKAVVGMQIYLDGRRLSYSYDVWQYNVATGWQFQYANAEGTTLTEHYDSHDGKYISVLPPVGANTRFLITKTKLEPKMPECYKIVIVRHQFGNEISREYEYSDSNALQCASSEYSMRWLMLQGGGIRYGGCTPQEFSCEYYISTGLRLGSDISLDLDGGVLEKEGVAYSIGRKYLIEALPVVTKPQDMYSYELEGWYTQKTGGTKLEIGSEISEGDTLYARWKKTLVTYKVSCKDVLEGNPNIVLGETTWDALYGDVVSGGALGTSKDAGKYYQGREYTGCSADTVGVDGAQVYRYFKNADMTVFCIDLVKTGPDAGTMLGTNIWEAPYTSVVSGGALGSRMEVGVYYPGYQYVAATTQRVEENGCTIYRYFTPIVYDIRFVSNCASGGSMAVIKNCSYGHSYTLTKNSFINKSKITLDCNAKEATCDTSYQYVYQEFAGWSESPGGEVTYSDQCSVSNLCNTASVKELYAVWSDKEVTVTAVPKRLGYEFAGWSKEPEAKSGKKQFQILGDETLYAIWKSAPVKYHVQHYKQQLNQNYELAAEYEFSAYTGDKIVLEEMEDVYQGYCLDSSSSNLQGTVKADGSLVLSIYYRRGEYSVSFDWNGGQIVAGKQEINDIRGVYEEEVRIPEVYLQRQGYEFAGWGTKPESTKIVAKSGEKYLIPNHNQVLYAVWLPKNNTPFSITPYYENTTGTGYIQGETIDLYGYTDSSILDGICDYYNLGIEESIAKMFGNGYQLFSKDGLERKQIAADGTASADIYLERIRYQFVFGKEDSNHCVEEIVLHGQIYCFPKQQEGLDIKEVDYYKGTKGEIYYPGDIIQVTGDGCFYSITGKGLPESTKKPQPTNTPLASKSPEVNNIPDNSSLPMVSAIPLCSSSPEVSSNPEESQIPKATLNPEEVSAVLEENKAKMLPAKGSVVKKANLVYKVTSSTLTKKTVKVTGMKKQTKKIVIPGAVSINGYSYQVTEIGKSAFSNQKKLRKIVVGNNIKRIGKKAFAGSSKLKTVVIKAKNVKTIGKDVWKGIAKNCSFHYSTECSLKSRKLFQKTYEKE